MWKTLAGFIQAQATIILRGCALFGLGLWALGVPLAFVLAVVTFPWFIPIRCCYAVARIVIALVSNGLINALLVLALILLVQQIETVMLQPILQSRLWACSGYRALSVTVG